MGQGLFDSLLASFKFLSWFETYFAYRGELAMTQSIYDLVFVGFIMLVFMHRDDNGADASLTIPSHPRSQN